MLASSNSLTVPIAFLPATSDIPSYLPLPHSVNHALQVCITTSDFFVTQFEEFIQTPAQTEKELKALIYALNHLQELLLSEKALATESIIAREKSIEDMNAHMAEACTIYDKYFHVVRVAPMTLLQFIEQVAHASLNVLYDLSSTFLDRNQIIFIIRNINQMLKKLRSEPLYSERIVARERKSIEKVPHNIQHKTNQDIASLALYRWKIGHHFFNLCAIFCRSALQQVSTAIEKGSLLKAQKELEFSALFMRGSTAAVWYAGDFPMAVYANVIRPSMEMPDASVGFSGDQNTDYNRMKVAKKELSTFLCEYYNNDLSQMPKALYRALINFHEANVQDMEHHVLIAANKVGADQSLTQKKWMDEISDMGYMQSAVDILREMVEMRRKEFQL